MRSGHFFAHLTAPEFNSTSGFILGGGEVHRMLSIMGSAIQSFFITMSETSHSRRKGFESLEPVPRQTGRKPEPDFQTKRRTS